MIGWYLSRSGQMPIDLENPHATLSSLGGAVKALRAGMPLFVFPEGGRTSDGALRPFLAGAAYLAIRAQCHRAHCAQRRLRSAAHPHQSVLPHPLTVQVGEPIDTKGMNVRQNGELTERLRAAIGRCSASRPSRNPRPVA